MQNDEDSSKFTKAESVSLVVQDSLRSAVAVVPQDTVCMHSKLFDTSLNLYVFDVDQSLTKVVWP